jgi:hypothetical protein
VQRDSTDEASDGLGGKKARSSKQYTRSLRVILVRVNGDTDAQRRKKGTSLICSRCDGGRGEAGWARARSALRRMRGQGREPSAGGRTKSSNTLDVSMPEWIADGGDGKASLRTTVFHTKLAVCLQACGGSSSSSQPASPQRGGNRRPSKNPKQRSDSPQNRPMQKPQHPTASASHICPRMKPHSNTRRKGA